MSLCGMLLQDEKLLMHDCLTQFVVLAFFANWVETYAWNNSTKKKQKKKQGKNTKGWIKCFWRGGREVLTLQNYKQKLLNLFTCLSLVPLPCFLSVFFSQHISGSFCVWCVSPLYWSPHHFLWQIPFFHCPLVDLCNSPTSSSDLLTLFFRLSLDWPLVY